MGYVEEPTEKPTSESSRDSLSMTRRDFFGLSWRVLGALALGQAGYIGLRFLASREAEGMSGEVVIAGLLGDFPLGTITPFDQARFFLVRFEDGGFLALHSKCTHLACVVAWNEEHQRFSCPCHGSEFERDGDVINPPAPTPLERFEIIIDADRVKVDTRKPIRRSSTSPSDLVYAPDQPDITPEADSTPGTDGTPGATPDVTPTPTPPFTPPDR